jgi:hypothetical protein
VTRAHVTGYPFTFYDVNCKLHEETILQCRDSAKDTEEVPIGVFSFRRGMPLQPTIRERAVLRALDDHLRNGRGSSSSSPTRSQSKRTNETGAVLLVMNDISEFALMDGQVGLGCRAYAICEDGQAARHKVHPSSASRRLIRVLISARASGTPTRDRSKADTSSASVVQNVGKRAATFERSKGGEDEDVARRNDAGYDRSGPLQSRVGNETEQSAAGGQTKAEVVSRLKNELEATRQAVKAKAEQLRLLETQAEELAARLEALGQ